MSLLYFIDGILYGSSGLVFVVIGAYFSLRLLDFPDLTVDGVFTLGACIFARTTLLGLDPWLATLLSAMAGTLSGVAVHQLNARLGIGKILSSVIVLILLGSVNTYVLGQATVGLIQENTIFSWCEQRDMAISKILLPELPYVLHPFSILQTTGITALVIIALWRFLKSEGGTIMRCVGNKDKSGRLLNEDPSKYKLIGLIISSFFVSLGGTIEAQRRGGADLGMGVGMLLIALCAVVVGESTVRFIRKQAYLTIPDMLLAIVLGTLLYSSVVQIVLGLGFSSVDIKVFTGIILIVLLSISGRMFPRGAEYF